MKEEEEEEAGESSDPRGKGKDKRRTSDLVGRSMSELGELNAPSCLACEPARHRVGRCE